MTRDRRIVENQGIPEYAVYADLPPVADFKGLALTQNDSALHRSNGVEWFSYGSSVLLADRPAASLFGKGEWVVNGTTTYLSDGTSWVDSSPSSAGAQIIKTTPAVVIVSPGTASASAASSKLISGYGNKYNTTNGLAFSHILIKRLGQTTAVESDFWQTITVNVRATDDAGAIVASGTFSATPYATSYDDVLFELLSSGVPKTVTEVDIGSTYWVEYVATNRNGGRAPLGFSMSTLPPENQALPSVGAYTKYQLKSNGVWSVTGGTATYYAAVEPWLYSASTTIPAAKQITPELLLPPIYAVVGRECNVYFDGLTDLHYKKLAWDVTCAVGTHQNERFTVTPIAAAASVALTIAAQDIASLDTVATAASTIKVAADTAAGTFKCLFIGDSTTASGEVVTEVNVLATADVNLAVTMLGTQGSAANLHEGRSGWTSTLFTTSGSPFFIGGVIDFAGYMTANGYASVDRIIINLGINDMFNATTDATAKVAAQTCVDNLGKLITSIQRYSATCLIGVALTTPPSANQDAFGKNYTSGQTYYRYKRNIAILYSKLLSKFAGKTSSNIWLIPYNVSLDTENNMSTETVAVNSRNSATIVRQSNGVHPAAVGYLQIADAIYAWIKCTI